MRKAIRHSVLYLLLLCPAFCWAQRANLVHDFHAMLSKSQLTFPSPYQVARTPELWYSCSGGATFGTSIVTVGGKNLVSINLTGANHIVTTSALDSLSRIQIIYYPANFKATNIELQLSRDSVHWSNPIVPDNMYENSGSITASFVPGRYYVRLTNTSSASSKRVSIYKIKYSFDYCNCFMYIP